MRTAPRLGMSIGSFAITLAMAALLAQAGNSASKPLGGAVQKQRVYVGTYTNAKSKGIYLMELDLESGSLSPATLAAEITSPSFLAIHPSRRYLYAVNEVAEFKKKGTGAVTAFSIDPATGKLTQLNQQSSGGGGPCHVVVDHTGTKVLVANYGGGSASVLPIESEGRLGPSTAFVQHTGSSVDKRRQTAPHAHSINLDPKNHFAFVADLGLDKVLVYRFDAHKGTLTANDPPAGVVDPGAGPRHFAFHPNGHFAYVINEMHCTVTAFTYNAAHGSLTPIQTITTLPIEVQPGFSTAEVQVHPSGKFLYGSNRGHHSIAIFSIDPHTGKLTPVGHQS